LEATGPESLFASVITVGEIGLGIEDLPIGRRRQDLELWVEQGLPAWFESHLLPVTRAVADIWGRLTIQGKKQGHAISTADGLIVAAAIAHDLTLVTRNVADFSELAVPLLNPWDT
jgi:predicted nucleic acid-binding protein